MQRFFCFFAPYTSAHMPLSYRRWEALWPLVAMLVLAGVAMVPLAAAQYWVAAVAGLLALFFVFWIIFAGMHHLSAKPNEDGVPYISPSVITPLQATAFFYILAITIAIETMSAWYVDAGW